MERNIYFVLVIFSSVRGEFISNVMFRNSSYDNKAFLPSKLLSSSRFRSIIDCAADCTKDYGCKSLIFDTVTRLCELLSAHKEPLSNTTSRNTTGWLYYEKMNRTYDVMPTTTITSTDATTEVVSPSQESFNCSTWHFFSDHWYILDATGRTFNESKIFCAGKSSSAYIIEVNSQAENDWLVELTSSHCNVPQQYWLNGFDTDDSGKFIWLMSNKTAEYTNWGNSEPSHLAETCIESDTMYGGEWTDTTCTYKRSVVCEKNS